MVIRGNPRTNGRQLSYYLLSKGENEDVWILDADGRDEMSKSDFSDLLFDMSITAELTKSKKGLYHAQINPAIDESNLMTNEKWFEAVDILGKELGLEYQRRAVIMHKKHGRIHAHVVWERFNLETGKMISDSFSRLAQDRARMEMECRLELEKTPKRNAHRPELKEALTKLWQDTATGKEFIKVVDKAGYMLAAGTPRHPFMIVDQHGRTFDLVRQLKGTRIKEVRERMKGEVLTPEKNAIEIMRAKGDAKAGGKEGRGKAQSKPASVDKKAANEFIETGYDIAANNISRKLTNELVAKDFAASRNDMFAKEDISVNPKEKVAQTFAENRSDTVSKKQKDQRVSEANMKQAFKDNTDDLSQLEEKSKRERKKQEFKDAMKTKLESRDPVTVRGREPD